MKRDLPQDFVSHEQMTKNLLALKAEMIGQWNHHIVIVQIQDLIEKLNLCLHDNYPPKK